MTPQLKPWAIQRERSAPNAAHVGSDIAVLLVSLAVLVLWEASGWDLVAARRFGTAAGFSLQEAWWSRGLIHNGGRNFAYTVLAIMVLDAVRPLLRGPARAERWRWIGVTLASVLLIPTIKRFSATSCPWDLTEFGGKAAYVPHWLLRVADGGPGHCFPSGHAVAAFAFFTLYFLWRNDRPVFARWLLAGVCATGLVFGYGQLARGAHFPSHTMWSACLCWAVCVAADHWRRAMFGRHFAGMRPSTPAP